MLSMVKCGDCDRWNTQLTERHSCHLKTVCAPQSPNYIRKSRYLPLDLGNNVSDNSKVLMITF